MSKTCISCSSSSEAWEENCWGACWIQRVGVYKTWALHLWAACWSKHQERYCHYADWYNWWSSITSWGRYSAITHLHLQIATLQNFVTWFSKLISLPMNGIRSGAAFKIIHWHFYILWIPFSFPFPFTLRSWLLLLDANGTDDVGSEKTKGNVCRLETMGDILRLIFRTNDNSHARNYRVSPVLFLWVLRTTDRWYVPFCSYTCCFFLASYVLADIRCSFLVKVHVQEVAPTAFHGSIGTVILVFVRKNFMCLKCLLLC